MLQVYNDSIRLSILCATRRSTKEWMTWLVMPASYLLTFLIFGPYRNHRNASPRYSDEQLYALALYLYSLQPPPNVNEDDSLAERGRKLFEAQGCANCHPPPFYTNNKLTPASEFKPDKTAYETDEILPISVGTDPELTMRTRRGTGYYKVPSLKGVWYRSMFGHNGWCATLDDWFDPGRLSSDYVPTGFKGNGSKARAVRGHEFGLGLSATDNPH